MDGGSVSCVVVPIHIVGGEAEWDEVVLAAVGILVAVVGKLARL